MKTFYISKNGNQLGPFPVDEIQSMLMSGEINGEDFCWTDGMEQWQSMQEWDTALRAEAEISEKKPDRREESTEGEPCAIASPLSATPEQQSEPAVKNPLFKFDCPYCQQKISTEEDYSGKNVQCPTCGAAFVVPSLSASALRAEEEIKVPVTPHPQPLGQRPLKQPDYQAPQMKTSAGVKTPTGPRRGKGILVGVLVAAAIVMIGGVFLVLSSRAEKRQMAKNIDATVTYTQGTKVLKFNKPDPDKYTIHNMRALLEQEMRGNRLKEILKNVGELTDRNHLAANMTSICDTDWSKCSPELLNCANNFKLIMEVGYDGKYTKNDLIKQYKQFLELSGRITKSFDYTGVDINSIIDEIAKKISKEDGYKNQSTIDSTASIDSENRSTIDPEKRDEAEMNAVIEEAVDMLAEAYPELNRAGQRLMLERLTGYKIDSLKKARRAKSVVNQLKIAYQVNGSSLREAVDLVLKLSQN